MRISDFDLYKELLARKSGLALNADQSFLLDSRLTPVAKKWGYPTLDAMSLGLRAVPSPAMIDDIVEAMTDNQTSFFRDRAPFEHFRDVVLPYFAKTHNRKRVLRIWCAGCATGEEVWSIAMLIRDYGPEIAGWKIEIIGTDLSARNIAIAAHGLYSQFDIQRGLSMKMAMQYFTQRDDSWEANDELRKLVSFRQQNLLARDDSLGLFSVVLCRNVLTNLEEKAQTDILNNIAGHMEENGFLYLGQNEQLPAACTAFTPMENLIGLYGLTEGRYNMIADRAKTDQVTL